MSGVFVNVNRGKRGITLDLKSDAGRTAVHALLEGTDVFIHSMRAAAIHQLLRLQPAGTNRDLPAYDDTIQAACGLPSVQQQLTGAVESGRNI